MNNLCFMTNLTSSEWAAWVPAIGSVTAIFVAVAIPSIQHRREQRRTEAEAKEVSIDRIFQCQLIAMEFVNILAGAHSQLQGSQAFQPLALDHQSINELRAETQQVPIHRLDRETLAYMSELKGLLRQVQGRYSLGTAMKSAGQERDWISERIDDARRIAHRMSKHLIQQKGLG